MTWLIIILALIIVIGPIMYLVPNAADKRLTDLRAAARALGMNVQITSVPKLNPAGHERVSAGGQTRNPRIACSAYRLPLGGNVSNVGQLMLMKVPSDPTLLLNEVVPGWALDSDSDSAFWTRYNAAEQGRDLLLDVAPQLPNDVLALALDDRTVSCYWRERAAPQEGAVEQIADVLGRLRDDLLERF